MVQARGVRDTTDILWCTRSRFIAYYLYVEGSEGATLEQKRPPLPSADLAGGYVPSVAQTCAENNKGYRKSFNHDQR